MPDTVAKTETHLILFSAPRIRAILRGEKTETRRVVKPQPPTCYGPRDVGTDSEHGSGLYWHLGQEKSVHCPYGKPGDVLMVREAFRLPKHAEEMSPKDYVEATQSDHYAVYFEADDSINGAKAGEGKLADENGGWARVKDFFGRLRPLIHMPYALCRIRLRVEEVRVERVQEITREGAVAEGWGGYMNSDVGDGFTGNSPRTWFHKLWDQINADRGYAWESNPWVWVVKFSIDPAFNS